MFSLISDERKGEEKEGDKGGQKGGRKKEMKKGRREEKERGRKEEGEGRSFLQNAQMRGGASFPPSKARLTFLVDHDVGNSCRRGPSSKRALGPARGKEREVF